MPITVKCPICGEIYEDIDETWQNQLVHCERCGKEFKAERYFPPPPPRPKPIFLIKLECPSCRRLFDIEESAINTTHTCPQCGNTFFSMAKYEHNIVCYSCPYCYALNHVDYRKVLTSTEYITCRFCDKQYLDNKFYRIAQEKTFTALKSPTTPVLDNVHTSSLHQSKAAVTPPVAYAPKKDTGMYILLALLFGGIGAHNLYTQEYDKFIFKLLVSGVALAFFIGMLANQPTVEISSYTYRVTKHTPDEYVFCLVGLCIAALINFILILADIICASDNCKGK